MMGGGVWDSDMATVIGFAFTGNSASAKAAASTTISRRPWPIAPLVAILPRWVCRAVYNGGILGAPTTATLTNCTLAFNFVTTGGGGLYNGTGSAPSR